VVSGQPCSLGSQAWTFDRPTFGLLHSYALDIQAFYFFATFPLVAVYVEPGAHCTALASPRVRFDFGACACCTLEF